MAAQITSSKLAWLERESERWQTVGLIDADTRARILGDYQPLSAERRSLIALVIVAVLMCGIGLLLLIGYNWERIPPPVRVGIIMASVAAAFAGSAAAYRRDHGLLGETLAFTGTLLFGNAIWLIAQVLHISGHFPDAFFWFGIGAIATAWLVESTWIGVGAVVLFAAWILAEGGFASGPIYPYVPVAAVCALAAYRLVSPVMLCATALSVSVWVFIATAGSGPPTAIMSASVVLAGCAMFAAGRLRRGNDGLQRAWQAAGLITLLITFVPLMVTGAQEFLSGGGSPTAIGIAIVLAFAALAGAVVRPVTAADVAVGVVALVVPLWAAALWSGLLPQGIVATRTGTVVFSLLALAMGLSLIRTALRSHRQADLVFGILFALAFLLVRWLSVIENMLWSGAFLVVTGGGLLMIARLWRAHARTGLAAARRLS